MSQGRLPPGLKQRSRVAAVSKMIWFDVAHDGRLVDGSRIDMTAPHIPRVNRRETLSVQASM